MNKEIIGIIGSGSWAMAMASVLASNEYVVKIWARRAEIADEINNKNTNQLYAPNVQFSKAIIATTEFSDLKNCSVIFVAIPVKTFREVLTSLPPEFNSPDKIFVSCSKGVEQGGLEFPSQIISHILPKVKVAAISGPNFAGEIIEQRPSITSIACKDIEVAKYLSKLVATNFLRCYPNDDLVSTEICGAIKNVFAIAAGILRAKKLGDNAFAALITRGLSELQLLLKTLGGDERIVNHPCGIGDIVLSTSSHQSRNFTFGYNLALGMPSSDKILVEGKFTAFALSDLAKKLNIELPITKAVCNSILDHSSIDAEVKGLMERPQRF